MVRHYHRAGTSMISKLISQVKKDTAASSPLYHVLNNPNKYGTSTGDGFGTAVACSSAYIAVSASEEDDAGGTQSGKVYLFDPATGVLIRTIDNPNAFNTTAGDRSGYSIACTDTHLVIGAYQEDETSYNSSGKVYVMNPLSGALIWTLNNPNDYNTPANDFFGWSVACSNSYVVVSAKAEDDALAANSPGKAYIFDIATGTLLWTLDNPTPNDYDQYGNVVACTDAYAIIGCAQDSGSGGTNTGTVYVYDTTTGFLLHTLNNPNVHGTLGGEQFGGSVGCSESYVIVGAPYEDDASSTNSGAAYVFDLASGGLLLTLVNPNNYDTSLNDNFGYAVACTELYAIVSAISEDSAEGVGTGIVYIFDIVTGVLLFTLDNPNDYGTVVSDAFGNKIACTDTNIIIGTPQEDDAGGASSGKAYLYKFENEYKYHLTQVLDNPNDYGTASSDSFGAACKCSEQYIVIGANNEDDASYLGTGKVYIFSTQGILLWTLDNPNAYGTGLNDNFGAIIGHSETYTIVGVPNEDDATGTESGKAYIYDNATGVLLWTLDNPNTQGTGLNDNFGGSVSCSETYSLVSALYEDTATLVNAGVVYLYENATGNLLYTFQDPNLGGDPAIADSFGFDVGCTDTHALIGVRNEKDLSGDSAGAAYIYDIVTRTVLHHIVNPNNYGTGSGDNFSQIVAISDSYSAVCARGEDTATSSYVGVVYVFSNDTGALLHTIENPSYWSNPANNFFGQSLQITDDYLVAGSNQSSSGAIFDNEGIAYVFDIKTGELINVVVNPNSFDTPTGDYFAYANGIGLSKSFMVISSYGEDESGQAGSGKAYIFSNTPLARIYDNPNDYGLAAGDSFGTSVACSENYVLVGARGEYNSVGNWEGSGTLYVFNVSTGEVVHTIINPNPDGVSRYDNYGHRVACTDTYIVASAPQEGATEGKVYIHSMDTGLLLNTLDNPNAYDVSANDYFGGEGLACTDTYLVVGNHIEGAADAGGTTFSGHVFIYNIATGALLRTIDNPNPFGTSQQDQFGYRVACTDTYVVATAHGEDEVSDTWSGKVYVYNIATGALLHTLTNPNAYDTPQSDYFGYGGIACTDSYVVVSAPFEDDVGGTASGKAYIFDITTGLLLHTLDNPNAYGTSVSDLVGGNGSASIACTDSYAFIGATGEDSVEGGYVGIIYMYDITTGILLRTIQNPHTFGSNVNSNFGGIIACNDFFVISGLPNKETAAGVGSGVAYQYNLFKEIP